MGKGFLRAALSLIVAAVSAVAASYIVRTGLSYYQAATLDEEAMEKAALASSPKMYSVLKERFPAEYAQLMQDLTALAKAGKSPKETSTLAAGLTAAIRSKYALHLQSAPDSDLSEIISVSAAFHKRLLAEEGAEECSKFAREGAVALSSPEKYRAELDSQASALFQAVAEAIANPNQAGEAQQADWEEFYAVFVLRGYPDSYIDILDQQALNDPKLCPALLAMMEAVNAVHGEAGRRLRASFVRGVAEN